MSDSDTTNSLSRKFNRIKSELDERGCRLWAASEAMELGHGGIKAVAKATGLGERTVRRGCKDLRQEAGTLAGLVHRARNSGGGRKPLTVHDPKLVEALAVGRADSAWRPHVAVTVDLQKHPEIGLGAWGARTPGEPHQGRTAIGRLGLQLAGEPQNFGREVLTVTPSSAISTAV